MNHLVLIIIDSCRYDATLAANIPNLRRLGPIERRFSYASWTLPSHHVFMCGLMPHRSPTGVLPHEVYRDDMRTWGLRVGTQFFDFGRFVPQLSLPRLLGEIGYRCTARVSLPVIGEHTLLNSYFHSYRLMDSPNRFHEMVDETYFDPLQPQFYLLNLGETHYPYMSKDALPYLPGVNGVFRLLEKGDRANAEVFNSDMMKRMKTMQVRALEHVDRQIGRLFSKAPENTYFVVTADHGELFGEDGYFGHGPIQHEKCFEVPYVEGPRP